MSIFDTSNPQAESGAPGSVAFAPRVGFLDAWQLAYEAHVRTSSMSALDTYFEKDDEAQAQRWGARLDGSKAPRLRDIADYSDIARYLVDGEGLTPEQVEALNEYDAAAAKARTRGLDVQSHGDVFKNVQKLAQDAERKAALTPTSALGSVGAFAGGTVAALDPRTDFWNFATLPVGGAGKTIATRVLGQVGAQSFIETVNQITGVQENRRLLGLEHGFTQGAMQVLATGAGAGVLQGVGEGGVALARRWFGSPTKADPGEVPNTRLEEPPPPPPAPTREEMRPTRILRDLEEYEASVQSRSPWHGPASATSRTDMDVTDVTRQLDDWEGPRPWELAPRTQTAIPSVLLGEQYRPEISVSGRPVDDIARTLDPDTFRAYDKLASMKARLRDQIEGMQEAKQEKAAEEVADLNDEITRLRATLSTSTKRIAKKNEKKIAALEHERDTKLAALLETDTPEIAFLRRKLTTVDERMRDLAPVVSRAYTKARGRWEGTENELNGVVQMIREGRDRLPETTKVDAPKSTGAEERSPVARMLDSHPEVRAEAATTDDAADLVGRAIEAEAKVLDTAVAEWREILDTMKLDEAENTMTLEGSDFVYDLDKDTLAVPIEDGEGFKTLTIREVLEASKRDELELKAMTTCSIRTS